MISHEAPISAVATGGDLVATGGYDNRVILWSAPGKAIAVGHHDHLVNDCDFSPEGDLLLTCSSDHTARIWSVPDLKLVAVLGAQEDDAMRGRFSPDRESDLLAVASYDGFLNVYDRAGNCHIRVLCHEGLVEDLAWSSCGQYVFTCGTDGRVAKTVAQSGEMVAEAEISGVDVDVVAALPHGAVLAGCDDGLIRIFNSELELQKEIRAHESGIKTVAVGEGSNMLVSVGYDGIVKRYSLDTSELIQTSPIPTITWPRSAAITGPAKSPQVAFATFGSTYAVWEPTTDHWHVRGISWSRSVNDVTDIGGRVYTIGDSGVLRSGESEVGSVESLCNFAESFGEEVVVGGQAGSAWALPSGRRIVAHHSPINCAVNFQLGGQEYLAIGAYDGSVLLVKDGIDVQTVKVHLNAVKGIAFDGQSLFTGAANGELAEIDPISLTVRGRFTDLHQKILNDIAVLGLRKIATVSRDKTICVWNNGQLQRVETPLENSIKAVAADSSGTLVACGSYRGQVAVYDLEENDFVFFERLTFAGISSLCWSGALGVFLAASYDGSVYPVALENGTMGGK